jgi:hypothetical protein
MEISGNRLNPYQLPSPDQRVSGRASSAQGFLREQIAADKHAAGSNPQDQVTQERAVQSKGGADYVEILQRSRAGQSRESFRRVTAPATESLGVRRALDAYQSTANDLEGSGIELLPRVDRYV